MSNLKNNENLIGLEEEKYNEIKEDFNSICDLSSFATFINQEGLEAMSYEMDYPEEIMDIFKKHFEKDSSITILDFNNVEDTDNYNLSRMCEGMYTGYWELIQELIEQNYDVSSILDEDEEFVEEFEYNLRDFLIKKQGPIVEIFGEKFAQTLSPYYDKEEIKNFIINYMKNNK